MDMEICLFKQENNIMVISKKERNMGKEFIIALVEINMKANL